MIDSLLLDTSVLLKWFHADGEPEVAPARALRGAHQDGMIEVRVLDLAIYELGNVLVRSLGWRGSAVADQLDDLTRLCGTPLVLDPAWRRRAAQLAEQHGLSFYDAAWAATAAELDLILVSAERQLLRAELAQSATVVAARLRLS